MLNISDWTNAGYKRFTFSSAINKNADFGLQKLFSDDIGKRYYITVYVYDRSKYPGYPWQEAEPQQYGFMPTCHFLDGSDGPFFNLEMNGTFTISECEVWFNRAWEIFGKPYYRKDYE
jgi:hypothetical protein